MKELTLFKKYILFYTKDNGKLYRMFKEKLIICMIMDLYFKEFIKIENNCIYINKQLTEEFSIYKELYDLIAQHENTAFLKVKNIINKKINNHILSNALNIAIEELIEGNYLIRKANNILIPNNSSKDEVIKELIQLIDKPDLTEEEKFTIVSMKYITLLTKMLTKEEKKEYNIKLKLLKKEVTHNYLNSIALYTISSSSASFVLLFICITNNSIPSHDNLVLLAIQSVLIAVAAIALCYHTLKMYVNLFEKIK